jgi:hypothetical protein
MSELVTLFTYNLSSLIAGVYGTSVGIYNIEEPVLYKSQRRASTYNDVTYDVIKYNKHLLTPETIGSYGLCRSVILNKDQQIVSFAPPKSIALNLFLEKYPSKIPSIIAEEMIEGTMINVFWDGNGDGWELKTCFTCRRIPKPFSTCFKKPRTNVD